MRGGHRMIFMAAQGELKACEHACEISGVGNPSTQRWNRTEFVKHFNGIIVILNISINIFHCQAWLKAQWKQQKERVYL